MRRLGTSSPKDDPLSKAKQQNRILGTTRFYVHWREMRYIVDYVLLCTTRPVISLNRPQVGGRYVHLLMWDGLEFRCTTVRTVSIG